MELTLEVFIAIQAIVGGFIVVILTFLFTLWGKVNKMEGFQQGIIEMAKHPPESLFKELMKHSPKKANPYNPVEKNELIRKWQTGQLNIFEAQRLKQILEEDSKVVSGDTLAATLLALILIAALIYALSEE
jgi:hypothetical protein